MLKNLKLSKTEIIFTWFCSLILISGCFFGLSTPSGSLFLRAEVNADFPVQVWRKSLKKNTHEFINDLSRENYFFTDSSIKNLYIGIPQNTESGNVNISFKGGSNFKVQVTEVVSNWKEVALPMKEIRIARPYEKIDNYVLNYKYYQSPESFTQKSFINHFVKGMNWAFALDLWSFLKLGVLSVLGLFFILFIKVKLEFSTEKNIRILTYTFPILGFLFSTWIIIKYGVNMYWMDMLGLIELIEMKETGTLSWRILWQQHNEHRLPLVKLIFLFWTTLKSSNVLWVSFFNQCFVFAGSIYFLKELKEISLKNRAVFSAIFSFLMFSVAHVENTILPFHGQWHGTVIGMLMVSIAITKNKYFMKEWGFWLGFFFAYTSMPPWVCIPMAALAFIGLRHFDGKEFAVTKKELIHFFVFGIITLVLFALYMHGWNKVGVSPINGIYKDPVRFVMFMVHLIGNQVQDQRLAYLAGGLIISLASYLVFLRVKGRIKIPHAFSALFLFSFFWCFITAIGRSSSGDAILPRYVFISTGVWVSVLGTIWVNRSSVNKLVLNLVTIGFVGLISIQSLFGLSHGARFHRIMTRDAELAVKAIKTNDPIYFTHSEINATWNLKNDAGKRAFALDEFKKLNQKGYWKYNP